MIDLTRRTPEEYSRQSRDYQILARLYSALFNVSKMYIDDMSIWDYNIDNKLSLLRAKTLNFDPDHEWDYDDLDAVTSCFKYLVRNKGTRRALEYVISVLMKVRKINGNISETTIEVNNFNITIRVESDVVTMGILNDLIKYILPAGFTYRLISYRSYDMGDSNKTYLTAGTDKVEFEPVKLNKSLYIGDSDNKKRFITKTYVYTEDHVSNDKREDIFTDLDSRSGKYYVKDEDTSDVEG